MLAYLALASGKPEQRQVRGMRLWWVPMPMEGKLAAWQRRRRWRQLWRRGVQRAIFPPDLAREAEKWKMKAVPVYPLRRAVWEQMLPQGGDTALVRADHVDEAVRSSAMTLARRFRYLRLETGWGTERLTQELLRRYGLGSGSGGEIRAAVSFGGEPTVEGEICLGEDCTRWQKVEYEEVENLEGWNFSEELLCALFLSGAVKKEEIRVKRVGNNA